MRKEGNGGEKRRRMDTDKDIISHHSMPDGNYRTVVGECQLCFKAQILFGHGILSGLVIDDLNKLGNGEHKQEWQRDVHRVLHALRFVF